MSKIVIGTHEKESKPAMQAELIALEKEMHRNKIPYKRAVRLFKRQMILAAIDRNDCMKAAAMDLGVARETVSYYIRCRAAEILSEGRLS